MYKVPATLRNPLLASDVYKLGHMTQYKPDTTKVFSYLTSRSDRYMDTMVVFGLQFYLIQYLATPLEPWMAEEFIVYRNKILGNDNPGVNEKIRALAALGYWPLSIKAVPEGTVMPTKNVIATITNTHPDFYWCVGFIESLILKVWYPINVASTSYRYRRELQARFLRTCSDQLGALPFYVHDFGYRGDASEEGAGISGAAHLVNFIGSDTVPALPFVEDFYSPQEGTLIMASVPASEHSVMCSYGRDGEIEAFREMLRQNPNSIVSIVSDTYSLWEVLTTFADELYDEIMARPDGAKVVFRPDSGDPQKIICGDPDAPEGSPEWLGCLALLANKFGYTTNDDACMVLNQKVGLIYGDGMYFQRWTDILDEMQRQGWAASNLVVGIGGILRYHTRDTFGFTLKAVQIVNNGETFDIMKDPITDHGKKSHCGKVGLFGTFTGGVVTLDHLTDEQEASPDNLLLPVFLNGVVLKRYHFEEVRGLVNASLETPAVIVAEALVA